jgi:hypothetical protein
VPIGLDPEQAKNLLDIHSDLMTWSVDEQAVLQSVCGKLSSLRSGLGIFCARPMPSERIGKLLAIPDW